MNVEPRIVLEKRDVHELRSKIGTIVSAVMVLRCGFDDSMLDMISRNAESALAFLSEKEGVPG